MCIRSLSIHMYQNTRDPSMLLFVRPHRSLVDDGEGHTIKHNSTFTIRPYNLDSPFTLHALESGRTPS